MGGGRRSCGIDLGLAGFLAQRRRPARALRERASELVGGRQHESTTTNPILQAARSSA